MLRIYIRLLESSRPLGVRELARELGISVSTVHYSLKRLEELGLVQRLGDGYTVKKVVNLEGFLVIGRKLVPWLVIYSAFFLGALISETLYCIVNGLNADRLLAVVLSLTAFLVLFAEGVRARKRYG